MNDVCSFVDAIQSVPKKVKILEDVIIKILKQVVECAIFIREYTGCGFSGLNSLVFPEALNPDIIYSQTHETDVYRCWPNYRNVDAHLERTQTIL